MKRATLERHQVWVYLAAILSGLGAGSAAPQAAPTLELLLWPTLAILLFATFTQVPFAQLPTAFKDRRYMGATVLGNFVLLPMIVWGVLWLVPDDPAIRLGLSLVLLVPCTDWFLTFAHQAGGDVRRAIASTPVLLIGQMLTLPLYLWLFLGEGFGQLVSVQRMLVVFGLVIVLPLAAAYAMAHWACAHPAREAAVEKAAWLPVPLLGCVLFFIAASQVDTVKQSLPILGAIFFACVVFLMFAVLCALLMGRAFGLPVIQTRTLLFSFTTRNSFVVLPFALALPGANDTTAIVIVFQSMIELFSMVALLWLIPKRLLR